MKLFILYILLLCLSTHNIYAYNQNQNSEEGAGVSFIGVIGGLNKVATLFGRADAYNSEEYTGGLKYIYVLCYSGQINHNLQLMATYESNSLEGIFDRHFEDVAAKNDKIKLTKVLKLKYINLELDYSFHFTRFFDVFTGIKGSWLLSHNYGIIAETDCERLLLNDDLTGLKFLNPFKAELYNGKVSDINKYNLSVPIGLGLNAISFDIPFAFRLAASCEIPLTALSKEMNWKMYRLHLVAEIWFRV